jgi:hypothetical protein
MTLAAGSYRHMVKMPTTRDTVCAGTFCTNNRL